MSRRISRRVPPLQKTPTAGGRQGDAAAGTPFTLEQRMDEQLWEVTDSTGRHHGTFPRHAASDVLDRVWSDNPSLAWVQMSAVEMPETVH